MITEAIKTLPILPQNNSEVLMDLPEEWVFNQSDLKSHHLQNSMLRNLQERMENLEDKSEITDPARKANKEKKEILQFFGFRGISIQHILEAIATWLFRAGAVCGAVALYVLVKGKVFKHQKILREYHQESSSLYKSAQGEV